MLEPHSPNGLGMVIVMEGFNANTARSFLGKNVNLHLKDGSVIVNVKLAEIQKDEFERRSFLKCAPCVDGNVLTVPLKSVAWAEMLNVNILLTSGLE